MLSFAAAVFFLIATPGPGVLSAAGVGAGFGRAAGLRYVAGLMIGTNLVALAVVTGVAAAALADPRLRTILLVPLILFALVYVVGAVMLAAARGDAAKIGERYTEYLARGRDIAGGGNGRTPPA